MLDVFSRRVFGWAMADHLRDARVVDALEMAIWQRRPGPGAVHHSDRVAIHTSWAFGQRLREAALLGSMGSIGDFDFDFDNGLDGCVMTSTQPALSGEPGLLQQD